MTIEPLIVGSLEIRLLTNKEELERVQHMRYEEIVLEYNKDNINVKGTDYSPYDEYCDHIIAINRDTNEIIGTYRVMQKEHVAPLGGFLTEEEFDITALKNSPYKILELGRAVIKKEYRGSIVLKLIWKYLFDYVEAHQIRFLFGTASYHGTDPLDYQHSFAMLYHNYLIEDAYCPTSWGSTAGPLNVMPVESIDTKRALNETPSLIKGYLAMGAKVGNGTFIDVPFNSVDVFILLDFTKINFDYVKRLFK